MLIDVLGKEFDGVLGCDYFSAYRKYMKDFDVAIQFCIAHLIRNIRFLKTLPDEETRLYGEKLLEKVRSLFKVIHGREEMSGKDFSDALAKAKKEIIETRLAGGAEPDRRKRRGKKTRSPKHGEKVPGLRRGVFRVRHDPRRRSREQCRRARHKVHCHRPPCDPGHPKRKRRNGRRTIVGR